MYNSALAVLKGIRSDFAKGLQNVTDSVVKKFTEFIKSDTAEETFFIGDAIPNLQEWLDEIKFTDINDFSLTLKNKKWSNGTLVDRDTLNDSKKSLGTGLTIWIRSLINKWKFFPDKLINKLLIANPVTFDKTAFFATSRPNLEGDNTINNIHTGTGTTLAQVEADLSTARSILRSFKDRNGEPFNEGMKMLIYAPTQLESVFLKLASNEFLGSGESNLHKGTFELVLNDHQADNNDDWYIINIAAAMKPFIYQNREAPKFMMKDDEFNTKIKYATTGRSNASVLNPTAIIKVNN